MVSRSTRFLSLFLRAQTWELPAKIPIYFRQTFCLPSFDAAAPRPSCLIHLQLAETSGQTGLDSTLALLPRRSVDALGVQQPHLVQSQQSLTLLQQLVLPQFCKRKQLQQQTNNLGSADSSSHRISLSEISIEVIVFTS